jgi:unsaturated chondroitin disaccharide hydrolase
MYPSEGDAMKTLVLLVLCSLTVSLFHVSLVSAADVFPFAAQQLTATTQAIGHTSYPQYTDPQGASGSWVSTNAAQWTSGFFPGALWLMYQHTMDPAWRTAAQTWQAGIESQKTNTSTHDLGFMFLTSYGNAYRLTGNDLYRQIAVTAAKSLATRYSATVGCIKSNFPTGGSTDYNVIIDEMMDIELLFWGAKNGGEATWTTMATNHALKTAANHVRADGSTYHVVDYDPTTGAVKKKFTAQGYDNESTWSRGQAWAIYGFTVAYRYTHDTQFLNKARATADYFIAHAPSDGIPPWDFEVPGMPSPPPLNLRDSSAGAIATSGLLELSQIDPDATHRTKYWNSATHMLTSLQSSAYLAQGTANDAILLHGAIGKNRPFDRGLIYGDYYFLQALLRYASYQKTDVTLSVIAVSASSDDGNVPKNVLDNNLSTRWSAYGNGQWIKFDLGTSKLVSKVAIAWYVGNTRTAKFEVHTSADGTTWTTVFSGSSSGTTTQQETTDLPDTRGRYVRILGHGNSLNLWNSITEVDIFGQN